VDSLNFTIDGHLGIPGFVRVPPPFGTPPNAVRAIQVAQARLPGDPLSGMQRDACRHVQHTQWRLRLTVAATGVAITVAAALLGSHTGQRRPTLMPVIAQPPMPTVPAEIFLAETAPQTTANTATGADMAGASEAAPAIARTAPVVTQASVKTAKPEPRKRVRAGGRAAAPGLPAHRSTPVHAQRVAVETDLPVFEPVPITFGYAPPNAPIQVELEHHSRLID
jgi:hypothetical protein